MRNVALKQRFFHNGFAKTLHDAVAFYAERDTAPQNWYPKDATGRINKYNDLPSQYRDNVNTDAPFAPNPH